MKHKALKLKTLALSLLLAAGSLLGGAQKANAYSITQEDGKHEFFVWDDENGTELPTKITADHWVYGLRTSENGIQHAVVCWYRGLDKTAVIPHHINGVKVTAVSGVGEHFDGGGGIGSVIPWDSPAVKLVIPCTVDNILSTALINMPGVSPIEFVIPPSVTSIDVNNFGGEYAIKKFIGTITCAKGSAAHRLAVKYGLPCKLVSADTFHTWNTGVITKKPTTQAEGKRIYTCKACNQTKTEILQKLSAPVKTVKISGLKKSLKLTAGTTATLKPVISPSNSQDKLTFSSSKPKTAKVSSKGKITALTAGTAKITVKSGKKSAVVTVTVTKKPAVIKNVPKSKTLRKQQTLLLRPKFSPAGSWAKLTYRSSNSKVASVSSSGKITAKKAGKATITVKAGSISRKCSITVK